MYISTFQLLDRQLIKILQYLWPQIKSEHSTGADALCLFVSKFDIPAAGALWNDRKS